MIVDLHGHYAMHLVEELHPNPLRALRSAPSPASNALLSRLSASLGADEQFQYDRHRRRRRRRAILQRLFGWITATFNYRSPASGPGVTLELMKKGGVGVVLSPLLDPFNKFGSLPGWIVTGALTVAGGVLLAIVHHLRLAALALVLAVLVVAARAILNWRASACSLALSSDRH
jgi:hypothetical protein